MKRQNDMKNGQECGPLKKWKLEEELCFLLPHLREKFSQSTSSTSEEEKQDESCCDKEKCQECNITVPITLSPQSTMCIPETKCPAPETPCPTMNKTCKVPKKAPPRETVAAVLMKFILSQKEIDDIDAFFFSLAKTVKYFPPRQRAIAKAQIFSVVSNLELQMLALLTDPGPLNPPGPTSPACPPSQSSPVGQSTQTSQAVLTGQTTGPGQIILGEQPSLSAQQTETSQLDPQGQPTQQGQSALPGQSSLMEQSTQLGQPLPQSGSENQRYPPPSCPTPPNSSCPTQSSLNYLSCYRSSQLFCSLPDPVYFGIKDPR